MAGFSLELAHSHYSAHLNTFSAAVLERLERHTSWLAAPHSDVALHVALTLLAPWALQFVFSWIGFTLYMVWDYQSYCAGTLEADKLPSRHPIHESPVETRPGSTKLRLWGLFDVDIFWYSQLFMVPLVLYNQLVVWPLVSLLLIWPQWAQNYVPFAQWSWGGLFGTLIALTLISDQMWYWSHRLMHVKFCWKHFHRMHHIAPQCAISATYVHPVEYAMFCFAMQLPFALAGFPVWPYVTLMSWGMLTGSGAHSGYGGTLANGEKHGTGHHLYHSANFGLLMIADVLYGTHWAPGDPPPRHFAPGKEIESEFKAVKGMGLVGAATPVVVGKKAGASNNSGSSTAAIATAVAAAAAAAAGGIAASSGAGGVMALPQGVRHRGRQGGAL